MLDGKIYVSGGLSRRAEYLDALEAYDPVADTWTTLVSLSEARAFHTSAVINGKLYVFGGWAGVYGSRMDLVEVYIPASNSWARAADLPRTVDDAVAVAL